MKHATGRKFPGRGARNAQRREQEWLAANAPQRCAVRGKWSLKQVVCSRNDCLEKQQQAKQA
jgi:hypothetical protein